jgi:xylose isomerase
MNKYGYRFSFGPWNIHEGADPFGPPVRPGRSFADKLGEYQRLGFDAVQFHDDDAVPGLDGLAPAQIREQARAVRRRLEEHGLVAEFVAPRLWESPMTIPRTTPRPGLTPLSAQSGPPTLLRSLIPT